MLTRGNGTQVKLHCITIEDLVPQEHFLRKLDAELDLSFVYDIVHDRYSARHGRPSVDPVVLIKSLLLGYLYGIPSERQIEQRIQTDVALRWYLGLDLFDTVPDHSTISQNRRRRFHGNELFRQLFEKVVEQCIRLGLVGGRLVATDSTHVKANASRRSEVTVEVEESVGVYFAELDAYEAIERERMGKPLRKRRRSPEKRTRRVSTTDPDAGFLQRQGKPQGMHYLSHQTLDTDHGIILDVTVTPGDTGDCTPYLEQLRYVRERWNLPFQAAAADSAYDFSLAHQRLSELGIRLYVPPMPDHTPSTVEFTRKDFAYDADADTFQCPGGKQLRRHGLTRSRSNLGYLYRADSKDCAGCPLRERCVSRTAAQKTLAVNVFAGAVAASRALVGTDAYKRALESRQIWCEGSFAAQKHQHNLTRLRRRGKEAAESHCLLSATALNLKRMLRCLA